jgi:RNA polymerase sigma-70 factor (ECF subfamily)
LEQQVSELFQLLREPVCRYLMGILANRAEAEELTQEAFLSLYSCLRKGQAVKNVRAWVFRVAHNLAINCEKKRDHLEPLGPDFWEKVAEQRLDPAPNVEQRLVAQEKAEQLRLIFACLSPQERQCFDLRVEGLRLREIAEVLGIRIPSVESFLGRAIKKIMKEIHG